MIETHVKMSLRKKTSFAVLFLYLFVTTASANSTAKALEEKKILLKIHSTRTLTAHLTLGYDMRSLHKMAKLLHPGDVPVLIRLHNQDRDRMGIEQAIITQCGASLDGLAGLDSASAIMDITGAMSRFDVCDSGVRARAKEWHDKLRSDLEYWMQQQRSNR